MKRLVACAVLGLSFALATSGFTFAQPAAPAGKQIEIEYKQLVAGTGGNIELNIGDTIVVTNKFKGDVGLIEPIFMGSAKNTDKDAGAVLKVTAGPQVKRIDADTVRLWSWDAQRAGTAEVTFAHLINPKRNVTFTVTVKTKAAVLPKGAITVDLTEKLPTELELKKGDTVVFANGFAKVVATDTDGKGTLMQGRPHNTFNQCAAFQATREGTGELTLTFPSEDKTAAGKTATIKLTVK